MQLTPGMIHDLRAVSEMSTRKGWEYAGKLDIGYRGDKMVYRGITYTTSKNRMSVHVEDCDFHTHPGIPGNYVTLPSNEDFRSGRMHILCDNLGYYIIKVYNNNVSRNVMEGVRRDPFLRKRQVNDRGMEYFSSTLPEWKNFINHELSPYLLSLHGVDLSYHGYDCE